MGRNNAISQNCSLQGWEFVRFGLPNEGDWFLRSGKIWKARRSFAGTEEYYIVRKISVSETVVSSQRQLDIALSGLDAVSRIADADAYMGMSREEAMARISRLAKNAKDQAMEGVQ